MVVSHTQPFFSVLCGACHIIHVDLLSASQFTLLNFIWCVHCVYKVVALMFTFLFLHVSILSLLHKSTYFKIMWFTNLRFKSRKCWNQKCRNEPCSLYCVAAEIPTTSPWNHLNQTHSVCSCFHWHIVNKNVTPQRPKINKMMYISPQLWLLALSFMKHSQNK